MKATSYNPRNVVHKSFVARSFTRVLLGYTSIHMIIKSSKAIHNDLLVFNYSGLSDSLPHHGLQYTRLPCPSLSPGVCSNSRPLSWWYHPTISSSVYPFSFGPQSFPASASFPMSRLFTSGGQCIGASASASVLPINIQGWFPLGLTGLISQESSPTLQFESISSLVFSLWSNSHIHTWLLE